MNRKRRGMSEVFGLLWCAVFWTACAPPLPVTEVEQINDEWPIAEPRDVGIDHQKLDELVARIEDGTYENIHSILIVKDGKLVFEEYFPGYTWDFYGEDFKGEWTEFDNDTIHNTASVTKSFTSTLVGIAIDKGFIGGMDEKVFDSFPEYAHLNKRGKEQITLEDLLTMRAGLEWNGMDIHITTRDPRNDLIQLFLVPDPIEYILEKPIVAEPGTSWYYNGGLTNLLGEVIREASGMRIDDFAEEYLFSPLGIEVYEWDFINADMVHASGNLALHPRDMAKLGYLFLCEGNWNGEQLVSSEWVRQATTRHAEAPWGDGYGYHWWMRSYKTDHGEVDSFSAVGLGGQIIVVFPSLNMVVVLTGGNYVTPWPVYEIIENYVLVAAGM